MSVEPPVDEVLDPPGLETIPPEALEPRPKLLPVGLDTSLVPAIASSFDPDELAKMTPQEIVTAVMAASAYLQEGDPVGTIRYDPVTGVLAHRVIVNGVNQWRLSPPDGVVHYDMDNTGTLEWDVLHTPVVLGS